MNKISNRVGMINEAHLGLNIRAGGVEGELQGYDHCSPGHMKLEISNVSVTLQTSAPFDLVLGSELSKL